MDAAAAGEEGGKPWVLVADTVAAARRLCDALGELFECIGVHSTEQALGLLQTRRADALLVGYHFEELRPYVLIRQVRENPRTASIPVFLVRLLPSHLDRSSGAELREAYRNLGVNEFIELSDLAREQGEEAALEALRKMVLARL